MNKSKRKLLITMLVMMFVLLSAVAVVAIAFSLTQQTITTTLNITYTVEDIIGSVKAEYTIGSSTTSLTAYKNGTAQGSELIFNGNETSSDSFSLEFPQELTLTKANPEVIIKYTYANDGPVHYIASMDLNTTTLENMNVSYSIDGTSYSTNRYAVVVPANSSNKSYWIKISIANTALNASLSGEFSWFLDDYDDSSPAYLSLTSLTFVESSTSGVYSVSVSSEGDYAGKLVFPSEVNGTPVTKIVQSSSLTQEQKNQITSVFIPASVTEIGMYAFSGYTNLQEVVFEEGSQLTSILQGAFKGCTGLTSITIPENVTSIGSEVFSNCTGLTSITIPSNVTSIGTNAFSGCTSLQEVTFESDSQLTSILQGAFQSCTSLTSITIPSSVTSIDGWGFAFCANLTTLEVDLANTTYYSKNNCIIKTATNELVVGCKTSVIPTDDSVTSIGGSAFSGCTGLTSITIPSSVTSIGSSAFYGCTGLTSITIPSSVTRIGGSAFSGCTGLTSVTFENTTGWFVITNIITSSGTNLSSTDLANTATAATYLTSTYRGIWTRS